MWLEAGKAAARPRRASIEAINWAVGVVHALDILTLVFTSPQVDRVIAQRSRLGRRSYLVKWRGLGYAESTWESEKDLAAEQVRLGCIWFGIWTSPGKGRPLCPSAAEQQ